MLHVDNIIDLLFTASTLFLLTSRHYLLTMKGYIKIHIHIEYINSSQSDLQQEAKHKASRLILKINCKCTGILQVQVVGCKFLTSDLYQCNIRYSGIIL